MKYEGLIKMENAALKVEEREFLLLHNEIMYYGNAAAVNIVEMARKLKEMKDGKKYLSADFQSFGEYVESAVGIKERQAYNYISILERLPENFLQSNAKIGITKLALLAPLPSRDREEIAEEVDLEKISVRELEEKIAEKDKKIEQLQLDLARSSDEIALQKNDIEAAQDKISELENAPKPVIEDPETKKKLNEAIKAKKEAEKKLSDEIDKAKKDAADKQALIDNLTKQRDEATAKAKEAQAELNAAKEEKKPVFNNDLSFFKAKFEDFQRQGKDLINLLKNMDSTTPGDAVKCRNALLTLLTKIEEAAQ